MAARVASLSRYAYNPRMLGGMYPITPEDELIVQSTMLHRNRAVWGDDAEEFNPDHFSREAEDARPVNAWLPFGIGQRACIGRQFAIQEATLALGMMLQRFELVDHTNYQLTIKQAGTIKPHDFIRHGPPTTGAHARRPFDHERRPPPRTPPKPPQQSAARKRAGPTTHRC